MQTDEKNNYNYDFLENNLTLFQLTFYQTCI